MTKIWSIDHVQRIFIRLFLVKRYVDMQVTCALIKSQKRKGETNFHETTYWIFIIYKKNSFLFNNDMYNK